MTTLTGPAVVPANEHGTGFVAVAIRFPDEPVAHRAVDLYTRPDNTPSGVPTRFDGTQPFRQEIRPACRPDSNRAEPFYRLSVPSALHRGATACDARECFGGES